MVDKSGQPQGSRHPLSRRKEQAQCVEVARAGLEPGRPHAGMLKAPRALSGAPSPPSSSIQLCWLLSQANMDHDPEATWECSEFHPTALGKFGKSKANMAGPRPMAAQLAFSEDMDPERQAIFRLLLMS